MQAPQLTFNNSELAFIEDIGLLITDGGLPRSVGRVLGLLLVCEPGHQSAESIQRVLTLSTGSVSSAVGLLTKLQLVERVTFAKDRRLYYKLHPQAWQRILEARLQQVRSGISLVEKGLQLQPDNVRLQGLLDFYQQSNMLMERIKLPS